LKPRACCWRDSAYRATWMHRLRHASRGLLRSLLLLPRPARRPHFPRRLATGDERIYHIHLRKTGGTSLNHIFLGIGASDPDAAYRELAERPSHCCEWTGYRYVGWNPDLIMEGDYFYAFSHTPVWQLHLPAKTFTLTCFRDPVDRVLSHYWMLREYIEESIDHPCLATEGPWLGISFDDFLDRIPREHLKAQLWMFSPSCDVSEALDRVRNVSHVMFTEDFAAGLERLEQRIGVSLSHQHRRVSRRGEVSPQSLIRVRESLADEYEFLNAVKSEQRNAQVLDT
jgi:hypothetical protein